MNRKFSPKVKKIISLSRNEALRLGHDYIGTEHLLLGMLQDNDNLAVRVLDAMDVDFTELKFKIEDTIAEGRAEQTPVSAGNVPLNRQAERVLKVTFLEAKNLNSDEISPEHLMLSILKHGDNIASKVLSEFDINYESYKSELEFVIQEESGNYQDFMNQGPSDPEGSYEEEGDKGQFGAKRGASKSRTPVLDNFGRDITRLAEEDKLDPIIGREMKSNAFPKY